jgi:hypothetical protein
MALPADPVTEIEAGMTSEETDALLPVTGELTSFWEGITKLLT